MRSSPASTTRHREGSGSRPEPRRNWPTRLSSSSRCRPRSDAMEQGVDPQAIAVGTALMGGPRASTAVQALLAFGLTDRVEVVAGQRGDVEAALLLDERMVVWHHSPVAVVRHVVRHLSEVPRLAQDVRLEVPDAVDR